MQHKASIQLETCLDNNLYEDSQLIELKIPIHLPYQTNWADYERYDGEIQIGTMLYRYVKRKIAMDTLYVLCIPNPQKMKLQKAKNDYFNLTNGLMQNENSKKSGNSKTIPFKNFTGEFEDYSFMGITLIPWENLPTVSRLFKSPHLLTSPHLSPEHPPDLFQA